MASYTVFTVDGVDYSSYLAGNPYSWERSDIDAPGSGRDLQAVMRRKRIASKRKLGITCRRLTQAEAQRISAALDRETVVLTYLDPQSGTTTKTFYGSSMSSGLLGVWDGVPYWDACKFNLIEV